MAETVQEPVAQETDATEPKTETTVSKAEFDKVLNQMHEQKKRAKQLEGEVEKQKLDKLKEQQNWQEIAKLKEEETEGYKQKLTVISQNLVFDKKFTAIREAALKQGILSTALDDLERVDMSSVIVETTAADGQIRYSIAGADQFVANLKMRKPHWFETKGSRVNSETPGVISPKSVGWDEVKSAEAAYKKNPTRENEQKYKSAISEFQRTS